MWVNILPDGATLWGSFQQSDFHNQSPSCQNWSSNPPHKLHNFLCMCNLSVTGVIIHNNLSKRGRTIFLTLWGKCACAKHSAMMLECYEWMEGHWLLVCSGWLFGDYILARSKETNPSSYISMHPNNTFVAELIAQSYWKGFM